MDLLTWETCTQIQSIYDSGALLFPRNELLSIHQQLKSLNGGEGKVRVLGIDGKTFDFPVHTGRVQVTRYQSCDHELLETRPETDQSMVTGPKAETDRRETPKLVEMVT
jgi:hypothetical protein